MIACGTCQQVLKTREQAMAAAGLFSPFFLTGANSWRAYA